MMRLPVPTMKRHKQQQGNMAVVLPSEIIEDILLKLPVKSLIRFRCVSKPWRSLITDPRFVRKHVNYNVTITHHKSLILEYSLPKLGKKLAEVVGVTQKKDKVMTPSPLDLPDIVSPKNYYTIKGSCDGILCLIKGWDTLLLWNPRIGDYKRLALPELFCDSLEVIGFGYDSSIDDYKVVRVPSIYLDNIRWCKTTTVVEVLTLKSNCWRSLNDDFPFSVDHDQQFICANGGIYWLTNGRKILFFDLKEEKFSEVPLPTGVVAKEVVSSSLGNLGGCLCMLSGRTLNRRLDLWVMKGDTWLKLHTIPKLSGFDSFSPLTPLSSTKEGAVLMNFGKNYGNMKFVTYEPKDKTFKKITVDGIKTWLRVIWYAESLVSPCKQGD